MKIKNQLGQVAGSVDQELGVSDGSEFTLEEMFSGKMKSQKPVEERLHPVVYLKKSFPCLRRFEQLS